MQYVFIGLLAGICSGLGMGGGTVLIVILTLWGGVEQLTAQAINLVFFIPTACVATIVHIIKHNIHKKTVLPVALFGAIGAAVGAYIATHIEVGVLKKIFGIFLLAVAINEIYHFYKMYKNEKKPHTTNSKT